MAMKPYSFSKVKKFLLSQWFVIKRQKWSHVVFIKDWRIVVVPNHWNKDIPWPTIISILKQAGLYDNFKKGF